MTDPAPPTLADLLAGLAQITANLDAYVETRAQELAAHKIAEVTERCAHHADAVALELREAREDHARKQHRTGDLLAEMRRQLKAMNRHYEQGWDAAARYAANAAWDARTEHGEESPEHRALAQLASELSAEADKVRQRRRAEEEIAAQQTRPDVEGSDDV